MKHLIINLLVLIFFVSPQIYAQNESVLNDNELFDSIDLAAISGLRKAVALSKKFEFAGCVYRNSKGFAATAAASSGSQDDFGVACLAPSEFKLVGIFHTHPIGSETGISSKDIIVAKELNVTSYVAFMDHRKIMKYVPGVTRLQCSNGGSSCYKHQKISMGDLVAEY